MKRCSLFGENRCCLGFDIHINLSEVEDVIAMNKCLSNTTLSISFHGKCSKNK